MLTFVVRRLGWAVVLAALISFYTFLIFFIIPTDTRSSFATRGGTDPTLEGQFNLRGKSLTAQYAAFINHLVRHGDLGRSIHSSLPVTQIIANAAPVTATLIFGGVLVWMLIALPVGILSALYPRTLLDKGLMIFVLIGASAHPVWLGLMLSYFCGDRLHIFPVTGYCDLFHPSTYCGGPTQWAYHMVLPWFTFAFFFAAVYARMIRASMLETMDEDYVRTARAKGASTRRVLCRHVLRNAMLPVVSMLGMDIGIAFGGAVFVETIFGLPGMGKVLVTALGGGDLPVIMGVVLVVSFAVAIANLVADILYSVIDPRVRVTGRDEGSGSVATPRAARRAQPLPETA